MNPFPEVGFAELVSDWNTAAITDSMVQSETSRLMTKWAIP